MDMAKSANTQFTEDHVIREADGAPRLHLVASPQQSLSRQVVPSALREFTGL
jgi:hypothetical protein